MVTEITLISFCAFCGFKKYSVVKKYTCFDKQNKFSVHLCVICVSVVRKLKTILQ